MNIVLLSGGSGKRLWPLSNDIRSKQFIEIFKKPSSGGKEEGYESMVQRIYRQIKAADPNACITIATSKSQVSSIHNQLGDNVNISVEPCRRDTFPAIALATAYLHEVRGVPENEAVVVCPVDPYVEESYFHCVYNLYEEAQRGKHNLVLMGIKPTYPSEKYGYIQPINQEGRVYYSFKEKPDKQTAEEYIRNGALWNGGVFAYQLSYVLSKSREILGTASYHELYEHYASLKKISFDYAVVENERSIEVLRYAGTWKDIGTWNTLTEAMEEQAIGDVRISEDCSNVHVINELGIPVIAMGLKDVVIGASPDGILVADKISSSNLKPLVETVNQQVMYADKSWGTFRVLDVEEDSLTIKVSLRPGEHMNYHSHDRRDEVWTVATGRGRVIIDGVEKEIKAGDVISMPAGCKHIVKAETVLQLIEVQMGTDINVRDKQKFEMPVFSDNL